DLVGQTFSTEQVRVAAWRCCRVTDVGQVDDDSQVSGFQARVDMFHRVANHGVDYYCAGVDNNTRSSVHWRTTAKILCARRIIQWILSGTEIIDGVDGKGSRSDGIHGVVPGPVSVTQTCDDKAGLIVRNPAVHATERSRGGSGHLQQLRSGV